MQYIYALHETGDAGAHRVIYMDGRKHPDPDTLIPSWWGHSIGRWDGDTLVVDTVGYNDKFWFDAVGTPHTEKLHTIERWTRISYGTLVNDFTIEDPGTLHQTGAAAVRGENRQAGRRADGVHLRREQPDWSRRRLSETRLAGHRRWSAIDTEVIDISGMRLSPRR